MVWCGNRPCATCARVCVWGGGEAVWCATQQPPACHTQAHPHAHHTLLPLTHTHTRTHTHTHTCSMSVMPAAVSAARFISAQALPINSPGMTCARCWGRRRGDDSGPSSAGRTAPRGHTLCCRGACCKPVMLLPPTATTTTNATTPVLLPPGRRRCRHLPPATDTQPQPPQRSRPHPLWLVIQRVLHLLVRFMRLHRAPTRHGGSASVDTPPTRPLLWKVGGGGVVA
jgi:hypothetical protein